MGHSDTISKEKLKKWHGRINEIDNALEKNLEKRGRLETEKKMLEDKIKEAEHE